MYYKCYEVYDFGFEYLANFERITPSIDKEKVIDYFKQADRCEKNCIDDGEFFVNDNDKTPCLLLWQGYGYDVDKAKTSDFFNGMFSLTKDNPGLFIRIYQRDTGVMPSEDKEILMYDGCALCLNNVFFDTSMSCATLGNGHMSLHNCLCLFDSLFKRFSIERYNCSQFGCNEESCKFIMGEYAYNRSYKDMLEKESPEYYNNLVGAKKKYHLTECVEKHIDSLF